MKTDKLLKQKQEVLNSTFKKAENKNRVCCIPECNEISINSHVLQKNGILSEIAQNNHIWISESDFFKSELIYFKKQSINKSFTFKGFCREHDNKIFEPIENFEINFDDYKSLLLFTYRTVLNEKVKKEVLVDWHELQKKSKILEDTLDVELVDQVIEQQKAGIKDISYYATQIENDLSSSSESFVFRYRVTKPLGVCIASHFTYETTRERSLHIKSEGEDYELLTDIFISFFPIEDENILILGYLKEQENNCKDYIDSFFSCTEEELLKKISDLMLCRCEMWATSEKFYFSQIKPREKEIVKIMQESAESLDEDRNLEFNLFE